VRRRGVKVVWVGVGRAAGRASWNEGNTGRRAGRGGGDDGEEKEGGIEEGEVEEGGGLMAERSTSRGEEEDDCDGTTRVRPSNDMLWSACRFQHAWQMRLLAGVASCSSSSKEKTSVEGRG
jgi:hypothetical protein